VHLGIGRAEAPGAEPAVWVADAKGCLTATGLNSGHVLAAARWAEPDVAAFVPVAVAGNATHLFVIAPCAGGGKQVVLSAPIAVLMGGSPVGGGHC